jgi:hypothetical protein
MNKLEKYNKIMHQNSLEKFEKAKLLYITGEYSLTNLSKIFKINKSRFSNYLKNNNIIVNNKQNICKFNQHIFDSIDNEEKAYWLGFLFADGYVSDKRNNIELSLKLSDINHLKKFKTFLQWSGNIRSDYFRCRVSISNKHLKNILIQYGCTSKKSLTLQFPINILPKNLITSFIRGYFDGDGCTHISLKKTNCCIILIGTYHFISNTINLMKWKTNKLMHDKRHNENTIFIRYAGKTALTILEELYKDASIYLDRKYNKYKEFAVLYSNI